MSQRRKPDTQGCEISKPYEPTPQERDAIEAWRKGSPSPRLKVSRKPSMISGKIQGIFADLAAKGGKTARFSDYKSAGYAKIPYAPEQGIFWS